MPTARREDQELGHVFVVTYGRSGSTLLQGILNAIPGYLIRGENMNVVHDLYRFHSTMVRERRRRRRQQPEQGEEVGQSTPRSPYFGSDNFPAGRSKALVRRLVTETILRPEPDTRVTGFKEIRWHFHDDTADYLRWLAKVFPGARFLVNTRNLEDVSKSKWWGEDENAPARLEDIERRLLDATSGLGDAAFRVHFDDYVADPGSLRSLFDWLGEPFDEAAVRDVLGQRHSI